MDAKTSPMQNGLKTTQIPKKVYIVRNSLLTDLMEVSHLQSLYNIMVAGFSLLLINAVMFYISSPEVFFSDMEFLKWGSSKKILFFVVWLFLNLYAFITLEGFKIWVHLRNKINSKVADITFLVLYISSIIFMFTATPYVVLKTWVPPITALSLLLEQVRICMKVYSFVRECTPRALQYKSDKDGNQYAHIFPSRSHYLYYLFAPVFIYRDTYPRVKEIKWSFVLHSLFKFLACIFIAYCIFMRFIVDIFRHTGLRQVTLTEASMIYAGSTLVGATMMFLIFYCLLHSWLNFTGELLRFGDREFYQDWWNSTNFSQYYKKWNLVVYDWLYTYIYVETSKFGFSRSASMVSVFFISALVHEYVIDIGLRFFYPVLMVIYLTIGVVVMILTKNRTGQSWNIFMWSMLFAGWGVIVILYGTEWYARVNCPNIFTSQETLKEFFTPRSWSGNCHILKF